jgi:hypothetical protein
MSSPGTRTEVAGSERDTVACVGSGVDPPLRGDLRRRRSAEPGRHAETKLEGP